MEARETHGSHREGTGRLTATHAFSRSSAILTGKKLILEDTARDLLSRETLDEADLKAIQTRVAEA